MLRILGVALAVLALLTAGTFAAQIADGDGTFNHGLAVLGGAALAFVSLRYLVFPSKILPNSEKL